VRIGRLIIFGLGAVLALCVLAVLAITVFVDPNRFRGRVETAVREATGRPFRIDGDLDLAWFPWLAVRTGPAHLGNPPGEGGEPLIEWQSVRVGARLIPLLRGELIIDGVRLDGPTIRLRRDAQGRANWEDLLARFGESGEPSSSKPPRPVPQIGGIEIQDGTLEYSDARTGRIVQLSNWQLDIGDWKPGDEVPIRTQLALMIRDANAAAAAKPLTAQLRLDARARFSEQFDHVDIAALELDSRVTGGNLSEAGVPFEIELERLSAQLSPLEFEAPQLTVRLANAEVRAAVEVQRTAPAADPIDRRDETRGVRAHGPIEMRTQSLRRLLAALGVEAPLPVDEKTLGAFAFKSEWIYEEGRIEVKPVELQLDDTRFAGEFERTGVVEPVWTINLRGDRIDLGRYFKLEDTSDVPFELPVDALRALRVQGEVTFDEAQLAAAQMKGVRLRLGLEDPGISTAAQ
jgi:AsmA protein